MLLKQPDIFEKKIAEIDRVQRLQPFLIGGVKLPPAPVGELRAGEVGAVAKLTGSPSGSLLWSRSSGTARPAPLPRRAPVFAVSLTPNSQSDDEKLSTALGTDDASPRSYRYGWGVLDENLNFQVDPGEKKVYFEVGGFGSYVFFESPR